MKTAVAAQVRMTGLVRSPDREGALGHLDPERGFALVARGAMGYADVIDPTIWVKEKLALSVAVRGETDDPPLKRAIATLRAIHAELMSRPERERTWISALVLLYSEGEGLALIAGDCECYRFRGGILSRLGRPLEDRPGAPMGSLGSETQVKLELVPLLAQPGDCYILSTHPLREGEVNVLSRELTSARDAAAELRAGLVGSADRGRVAVRIQPTGVEAPIAAAETGPAGSVTLGTESETEETPDFVIEPLTPLPLESVRTESSGPGTIAVEPAVAPPAVAPPVAEEAPAREETARAAARDDALESRRLPAAVFQNRRLPAAAFEDRRPWYELFALWGGGALAIVAIALLIRAILPGILGTQKVRVKEAAMPLGTGAHLDLYSDPPGALVRVDGVTLESQTPATALSVKPGVHYVEMDWGVYGTKRDTVAVSPGARVALHPRLLGSVAFRSSNADRLLDVYLDGTYVGSTPLDLDAVVVGRHLVRYGGPGLNTTVQEVEVLQGSRVELVGSAGALPEPGQVTIRSALLGDSGFESSRGEPIWVDNDMRGTTPLTVDLKPGTHSFRVVRRGFPPQISILDVKPAGEQFVTAEFGARSEEPLRFTPPPSVSLSNPLPVTLALPESEWDASMAVWVCAAPPGGTFQPRRMTRIDESAKSFAALLPPEVLRNASRAVKIYFKVVGTAGRELYSEIYTIPVKD